MTTTDLHIDYKNDTGKRHITMKHFFYSISRKKNFDPWFTDEYCEWLEEKVIQLEDLLAKKKNVIN